LVSFGNKDNWDLLAAYSTHDHRTKRHPTFWRLDPPSNAIALRYLPFLFGRVIGDSFGAFLTGRGAVQYGSIPDGSTGAGAPVSPPVRI
jgi:hypothetical protein